MRKRTAFRPGGFDVLEGRIVLDGGRMAALAARAAIGPPAPAPAVAAQQLQPPVPPPAGVAAGPMVLDPRLTVRTVAVGLVTPIAMASLRPEDLLVLEKNTGQVHRIVRGRDRGVVLDLPVNSFGERGLLGIATSPRFPRDRGVYLYWTESRTGQDTGAPEEVPLLGNRVDRFVWTGSRLVHDRTLLRLRAFQDDEPEPPLGTHEGGVLRFGPDGKLYVVVGDLNRRGQLQNLPSGPTPTGLGAPIADDAFGGPRPDDAHLAGVILRLNPDGSTPTDNPFYAAGAALGGEAGANIQRTYAYGIRNSFGLDFDPVTGDPWISENGDDAFDELNRVEPGFNSGWIQLMGPRSRFAQYRDIERTFTTPPVQRTPSLRQVRWGPENIAETVDEALSRLDQLPGSHFSDPEFSWRFAVSPAAVGFLKGRRLGSRHAGDLFVGAGLPFTAQGYLFRFDLTPDRRSVAASDPRLADGVADNLGKTALTFDLTESESLLFGTNFGVVSDIQTGPNGHLHVVSLSNGAIYEVLPIASVRPPRTPRPRFPDGAPDRPDVIRIGALGDSVTDEYRFYPPHRTRAANWVELLAATRRVSFGPFGLAGRGEPRNGGFAYNWARSDATSAEMVRDQLPGLAAQAARGRIDYAGILIGGNDFIGVLKSPDPATALAEAGPRVARDILTAVTTLLAASPDVRVVVATLPDITLAPEFSKLAGIGLLPPPLIDALSGAIGRVNDLIRATAAGSDRVAVAELAALANTAPVPLLPFGGTTIDTRTPGDGFRHFVLADGRHPGVVGQGLIADLFVQAVDLEFGAGIAPLPPRQIVRLARAIQGRGR